MPVLIVGAGPVGLTLANLLGAAGVRTLVIEANAGTSDTPKAILIDDESFRTFQAIGLAEPIRDAVVYGTGARYYAASGREIAAVRPMVGAYGHPKRSAFGQPALERILLRGLDRFPHVEVRFGTRLDALERVAAGERATVEGRLVEAEWVVGCDGGRSTVRELSGIAMQGSSFAERWLIVDTANDPDDSRFTKFFCDPARPTVSVPAPGGGRRYEFMLLPGEEPAAMLAPAAIAQLVAPFRTLAPADIVRQTVYTFHALAAARFRDGRRLLAGDAAHMMPPFAGQGMNSGVRDAHNVAWKLAMAVRDEAAPALLDSYEAERRPHAEAMIALSVRLGRIVMSTSRPRAALRDAFFRALSLVPPAKDYVATMRWKPAPRYRAGLMLGGGGLVGAMLPQPLVSTGDGGPRLLDSVLGEGWALLSTDSDGLHRLTHPLWDRLRAERVGVLIGDRTPHRPGLVGDRDGAIARALAPHEQGVLLVRPDRYVAGVFAAADEARFADRFVALLGRADAPARPALAA